MEILRSIDQIYAQIDTLLGLNGNFDLDAVDFAFEIKDETFITPIAHKAKETDFSPEHCEKLFSFLFQLNDYTALLCNISHVFLLAKKYEHLFILINKIFVAHIGAKHYSSQCATSHAERTFDRLVEIVYTSNISNKLFVEFIVGIQKISSGNLSYWKNPSLEFLQNFFSEHEDWLMDFAKKNPEAKYPTLGAILSFNNTKGIDLLVKDFLFNPNANKDEIFLLLKDFKSETLAYLDAALSKADDIQTLKIIEILLALSSNNDVLARVQEIYATSQSPEVRLAISSRLGIYNMVNIRTEKQFLDATAEKIKQPQERSLGLPFDKFKLHTISGFEATNEIFSFIIFLFKEEKNLQNLYKLKVLETIFVKSELEDFVLKMFENLQHKGDILQAKWCVRMFALLCPSSALNKTFDFLTQLLKEMRSREAKYLIMCLIYSKKVEIIDFIKESLGEDHALIKECLEEFISSISSSLNMHAEDIKDMLVPSKFSVGEFDIQRDRLYSAFIAGKTYPIPLFKKMFLENKIYNKLGGGLVFGEYRLGRLCNAFIINGTQIVFIVGNSVLTDDVDKDAEVSIGIIHPLDMDFKFQAAINYFPYPTFDQFKPAKFSTSDHSISATAVNRFVGMMIDAPKFIQHVTKNGFQPNKVEGEDEFLSIIHPFPLLNLIAEVEFQKPLYSNSLDNNLSKICFYKLSDTMQLQSKYLTQKSNALPISTIPNRYFNHILSIVFEGSKL